MPNLTIKVNSEYGGIIHSILSEMEDVSIASGEYYDFLITDIFRCNIYAHSTPTILLSTSNVYSCLDCNNKVKEVPFTEDQPLVIPNSLSCYNQIQDIGQENRAREIHNNSMLLRICNVYGGVQNNNLIDLAIANFRHHTDMDVFHSLYRKKSFLYKEDFKSIMAKVIPLFVEGLRGVYNIGGTDIITVGNLLDTTYQTIHQTTAKPKLHLVEEPIRFRNFYEAVDISRIQALTNWKPEYSIRKGIWTFVKDELWKNQVK